MQRRFPLIDHDHHQLSDGRPLSYSEYGAPEGAPLFYFHGFPGSRLEARLVHQAAAQVGFRVVAVDRPGYGRSAPHLLTARLSAWAEDIASLADHLGFRRFGLLGVSGGAPYTLVCAAKLPGRVTGVMNICGLGPLAGRFSRTAMPGSRRLACGLIRLIPWLATPFSSLMTRRIQRSPESILTFLRAQVSEPDRVTLDRQDVSDALTDSFRESVRQGPAGTGRDLRLYLRPWDFDVRQIRTPVLLWHGRRDQTVPAAMSDALAVVLPNATARFFPDEGHYSLPINHMHASLEALAAV